MSDDHTFGTDTPTRREYVTYGGAVIGGGLLAGCAGQSNSGSTPTETTGDETDTGTSTGEDQSYSVTMSAVGTVEFDAVPERVAVYDSHWADHMVGLGQQDRIISLGFPDRYYTGFYEELPDVEFETGDLTAMYNDESYDKELLYELDADLFHIDPYRAVATNDNFDMDDVEEIIENVGPWFANRGSANNQIPGGADVDYEFYTLWELFSKFAEVYQVQDRSAALKTVRDELVTEIQSNLPPEDERPSVGFAGWWKGDIWVYDPNKDGFGAAHTRPVQLNDAFPDVPGYAASNWQEGKIDVEKALDADPDVWIQINAVNGKDAFENAVSEMKDDAVASRITAVQKDRIYSGGVNRQGPIYNLFQIEMTAKQVYPDLFGGYPGIGEPVPGDERLFDRRRVADIINGDI
ncbi:MAG: ABC transporter substrate-binding protein [Halapricum sp.]